VSGTPPQRGPTAVITAELFAEHWASIAQDVHGTLLRRGVRPEDAADVVQEVACRALSRGVQFDGPGGLRRWAYTVARNLVVEQARRDARVELLPDPDVQVTDDVAVLVERRAVTTNVARAFRRLSSGDQEVLRRAAAGAQVGEQPRKEAVRVNVRRYRARQRLMAMCEGLLALLGWLVRRPARLAIRVAAVAAATVCLAIVLWSAVTHDGHGPATGSEPATVDTAPSSVAPEYGGPAESSPEVGEGLASGVTSPLVTPDAPATADFTPTLSALAVTVPGVGHDGAVGWRPRTPQDHLICADTIVEGQQCADAPSAPASPSGLGVPRPP